MGCMVREKQNDEGMNVKEKLNIYGETLSGDGWSKIRGCCEEWKIVKGHAWHELCQIPQPVSCCANGDGERVSFYNAEEQILLGNVSTVLSVSSLVS